RGRVKEREKDGSLAPAERCSGTNRSNLGGELQRRPTFFWNLSSAGGSILEYKRCPRPKCPIRRSKRFQALRHRTRFCPRYLAQARDCILSVKTRLCTPLLSTCSRWVCSSGPATGRFSTRTRS